MRWTNEDAWTTRGPRALATLPLLRRLREVIGSLLGPRREADIPLLQMRGWGETDLRGVHGVHRRGTWVVIDGGRWDGPHRRPSPTGSWVESTE